MEGGRDAKKNCDEGRLLNKPRIARPTPFFVLVLKNTPFFAHCCFVQKGTLIFIVAFVRHVISVPRSFACIMGGGALTLSCSKKSPPRDSVVLSLSDA